MATSVFKHFPPHVRYGVFLGFVTLMWSCVYWASYLAHPQIAAIESVLAAPTQYSHAPKLDTTSFAQAKKLHFPAIFAVDMVGERNVGLEIPLENKKIEANTTYALYMPWVTGRAQVYVNKVRITEAPQTKFNTAHSRYPVFVRVPGELLDRADSSLHIVISNPYPNEGRVQELFFGSAEQLRPNYQASYFLKVSSVHLISIVLITMVIFAAFTHQFIQRDGLYPWFILISLIWVASNEIYLVQDFFLPESIRIAFFVATAMGTVGFLPIFARRYFHASNSPLESIYIAFCVLEIFIMGLLIYLVSSKYAFPMEFYLNVRALSVVLYMVISYWRYLSMQEKQTLFSLWIVSVAASSVIHPAYSIFSQLTGVNLLKANYLLTGAIQFVIIFASIFIERVHTAFYSLRKLNLELDTKVIAAGKEIEARYAELQVLKEKQVVEEERERIMQDIHDGVSGHLVAALAIAKRDDSTDKRIIDLMNSSITDLRLVIDSLVMSEQNLNKLLDNFKDRIEPLLNGAGIDLHWSIKLPPSLQLDSAALLNIYRCLQEIFTNVIRHSNASKVMVLGEDFDDQHARIWIGDNGVGFNDHPRKGRGLANVEKRMTSIGGYASFEKIAEQTEGARVSLYVAKR